MAIERGDVYRVNLVQHLSAPSGTVYPNGDLELALTIRTFAVADGRILWVGGGVVWDSDARAEIEESPLKARPLLAASGVPLPEAVHA